LIRVACVVEGDGEVAALPVLLRRLAEWKTPSFPIEVQHPIRVRRDRFLQKEDEFRRHVLLAASKAGARGFVLILLDADDDCPAQVAAAIRARVNAVIPHRRHAVVLANREYEAWFIAGAASLRGIRGFTCSDEDCGEEAEVPRNAKGWVGERMPRRSYHETTDQAAFSAIVNLELVHSRSRSFRKLCSDWTAAIESIA
jgi:anaerobic ribonucleoside-triphosphate reductase